MNDKRVGSSEVNGDILGEPVKESHCTIDIGFLINVGKIQ
jgi:hypothetical protein